MRALGILAALAGLVLLGACLGYGLGALAGGAWVWTMNATSFEGSSGKLVFFGFAPAGAVIGALVLPALYRARRARRHAGPANGDVPTARLRRRSF